MSLITCPKCKKGWAPKEHLPWTDHGLDIVCPECERSEKPMKLSERAAKAGLHPNEMFPGDEREDALRRIGAQDMATIALPIIEKLKEELVLADKRIEGLREALEYYGKDTTTLYMIKHRLPELSTCGEFVYKECIDDKGKRARAALKADDEIKGEG